MSLSDLETVKLITSDIRFPLRDPRPLPPKGILQSTGLDYQPGRNGNMRTVNRLRLSILRMKLVSLHSSSSQILVFKSTVVKTTAIQFVQCLANFPANLTQSCIRIGPQTMILIGIQFCTVMMRKEELHRFCAMFTSWVLTWVLRVTVLSNNNQYNRPFLYDQLTY